MKDPVLTELIDLVKSKQVSAKLKPAMAQVLRVLADSPNEPQAWQPLPPDFFEMPLPEEIKSGWLFALRAGGVFGNERHPNSWQRSIALAGAAEFELFVNGS